MPTDSDPSAEQMDDGALLREAVNLAYRNVLDGGRPFGAIVVKDGRIIARGVNCMLADNDPTAHAELLAIRSAAQVLQSTQLEGCSVYASGQPCPMCVAAMRMCGIRRVVFAYSNEQAEPYGLSTAGIAEELARPLSEQQGFTMEHRPYEAREQEHLYRVWSESRSTAIPHPPSRQS